MCIYFLYLISLLTEKETGREYAAKIIDLSDSSDVSVVEATQREIEVLRLVAGHPYISECLPLHGGRTICPGTIRPKYIYFLNLTYSTNLT